MTHRRAALDGGPQVLAGGGLAVNLHRLQDGTVAAHLINYGYDAEHDAVPLIPDLELSIRLPGRSRRAEVIAPGRPVVESPVGYADGRHQVRIDAGLYTIVVFHPDGEAGR